MQRKKMLFSFTPLLLAKKNREADSYSLRSQFYAKSKRVKEKKINEIFYVFTPFPFLLFYLLAMRTLYSIFKYL
jgi:hypothetical protein